MFNYYILRQNSDKTYNIEMTGIFQGTQLRYNTKIRTTKSNWDKKKMRSKDPILGDDINQRLKEMDDRGNLYLLKTTQPDNKEFCAFMRGEFEVKKTERKLTLIEKIDSFINNVGKRVNMDGEKICESRVRLYHSFGRTLTSYLKDHRDADGMNAKMVDEFRALLVAKGLSPNTIKGRFRMLHTIMDGVGAPIELGGLNLKGSKVENIVLSQEEVDAITDYRCDSLRLQNVVDLFTIGVYTGLRFSDFSQLKEAQIEEDNIIALHQKKTGRLVRIPLHPKVSEVITERGIPRPISGQKFNNYLREVAKYAGVDSRVEIKRIRGGKREIVNKEKWELISSHTCRRTFATLLYKKGVNPKLIMMLTGHRQLNTFMNYIVVDNQDAIEAVRAVW